MKDFRDYVQPNFRDRTQRAIDIARRRNPDDAIILISVITRDSNGFPFTQIIQNLKGNSESFTIVIEEKDTTNCLDLAIHTVTVRSR